MQTASDRVTAAERYARAASSTDLTAHADARCDADKLIAAGWAAQDPDHALALGLYRMAVTGDTQGLHPLVERAAGWINAWSSHKGRRMLARAQRIELAAQVLHWWLRPTCGYCEGRGFELVDSEHEDGARALSDQPCEACHGSGKRPLVREVPSHLQGHAKHLADKLDNLVLKVTGEMARRLRPSLDL
jgi:hypothetical protein